MSMVVTPAVVCVQLVIWDAAVTLYLYHYQPGLIVHLTVRLKSFINYKHTE